MISTYLFLLSCNYPELFIKHSYLIPERIRNIFILTEFVCLFIGVNKEKVLHFIKHIRHVLQCRRDELLFYCQDRSRDKVVP